jgi:hypothetical protein
VSGDDLTPLFGDDPAEPGRGMTYRQGTILTWDPATLENTVQVGGGLLTDLPILGLGEAASYAVGDVVGIMAVGSTWAIIGQLVIPGSAQAESAISLLSSNTYSASTAAFETRTSASWGDLSTVGPVVTDVRIGPSGRCLVWITSTLGLLVTGGGAEMAYEISGATTVGTGDTPPSLALYNDSAGISAAMSRLVLQEGLNTGLHTFTAKYSAPDLGGGGSARFGGRNLTVVAL